MHKARFVQKWFDEIGVEELDWPLGEGRFVHTVIVMLKQERAFPQAVATKLEAQNRLEYHCML